MEPKALDSRVRGNDELPFGTDRMSGARGAKSPPSRSQCGVFCATPPQYQRSERNNPSCRRHIYFHGTVSERVAERAKPARALALGCHSFVPLCIFGIQMPPLFGLSVKRGGRRLAEQRPILDGKPT